MSNLLCIDDIDVPDEEAIVNAVMQWVGYDVQGRQQDLEMLLSYVRLPLLPPQNMGIRIYNSSVSENVSLPPLDSITTVLYGRTQEPASETFCVPTAWKHKRPCDPTSEKYDLRTNSWLHSSVALGFSLEFQLLIVSSVSTEEVIA
ncbi:kelch-like protein 4 isoform X1 [Manis javanica]|uniref:kelch-like protein 4 isoform X1 n=1 Tax=Manis javanica TaxID=9974 RepID=UPI003C6D79A4